MSDVMLSEYLKRFGSKTKAYKILSKVLKTYGDLVVLIESHEMAEVFGPGKDDIVFQKEVFDGDFENPAIYGEYETKYTGSTEKYSYICPELKTPNMVRVKRTFKGVLVGWVS
jgi:hypothetical protein